MAPEKKTEPYVDPLDPDDEHFEAGTRFGFQHTSRELEHQDHAATTKQVTADDVARAAVPPTTLFSRDRRKRA